ncbi:MAG TPA: hypothetical protein VMZ69_00515 [Saprospiraceae bacterium]|nr:hypothetical protein [Saprospiraceae bacterium]
MDLKALPTSAIQNMFHIEMKKFQDGITANKPWEELKEISMVIRELSNELSERDEFNNGINKRVANPTERH